MTTSSNRVYNPRVYFSPIEVNNYEESDLHSRSPLNLEFYSLDRNHTAKEFSKWKYKVRLTSGVTRFRYFHQKNISQNIIVDLFGTIHIGEKSYYDNLLGALSNYDVVLYELITNENNTDVNKQLPHQRRLNRALYSKSLDQLSERFHWSNQMILPMQEKHNWYIADLSAEAVTSSEARNLPTVRRNYWWSVFGGRSFRQSFFPKFIIPDQWLLTPLRVLTWLSPCPEINSLLIDWARTRPKAGGISPLFLPTLHQLSQLRFLAADRLAFTQQILSGLVDAGSWGGASKSDIEVRIHARNRECCAVLKSFLHDLAERPNTATFNRTKKIAVVYGVYHIDDLKQRFAEELSLQVDDGFALTLPVWTVSSVTQAHENSQNWNRITPEEFWRQSFSLPSTILVLMGSAALYVGVGVMDWWVTTELIVRTIERISTGIEGSLSDDAIDVIAALTYVWLYVQRHWWCLQRINYSGIQWDRGLFA